MNMKKLLRIIGTLLLVGLGFTSCSKPADDPVNGDENYLCYYGVAPVYYHEIETTNN